MVVTTPPVEETMLKGIDHRLNADVLGALRAMGHGDYLIVSMTLKD